MQYIFMVLTFAFLEIVYKASTFGAVFQPSIIYILLFSVTYSTIAFILCHLTRKTKVNKIIKYILVSITCVVFASQYVYYCIYSSTFSYYSVTRGGVGQAFDFVPTIIKKIISNPAFFLFFIPIVSLIILDIRKVLKFEQLRVKQTFVYLSITVAIYCSLIGLINLNRTGINSIKEIYYNSNNLVTHVNKFGLLTGMKINFSHALFGTKVSIPVTETNNYELNDRYSSKNYNMLDINFDKLIERESDKNILSLHSYFKNSEPTKKNEYTGIFKGKNVIFVLAESFSDIAVDKNLTPTLYKLQNEGINFTNFYTPLFPVSTSDGEYMTSTSLIPKLDVWSLLYARNNKLPFTLVNMLNNEGYISNAYHNHSGEYFSRNISIPALGFSNFKDCSDMKINCNLWPESDLEMIENTYSDYINSTTPFLSYYITVSGHLQYKLSQNDIAVKNWNRVKHLSYSDELKAYLATQIELDLALEELLIQLDKANIADDTIIVVTGDHYPYGLTLNQLNEISSYTKEEFFDIHKNSLFIWHKGIKSTSVDKLASNLDIVPTLANMLGLKYDSRLLMGTDVFSDSPTTVILANESFITEFGKYNSISQTFKVNEGTNINEEYLQDMIEKVSNKFRISDAILTTNYYSKLFTK